MLNQICPCNRQALDTDHLHTCSLHSGNWQSAHKLVLSALADISYAAGYITNRGKRVPTSRGQKRGSGDLEIKQLQVAGTSDLRVECHSTEAELVLVRLRWCTAEGKVSLYFPMSLQEEKTQEIAVHPC